MCQLLHFTLKRNSFIVSEEDNLFGGRTRPKSLYNTVCAHSNAHTRLDLVRWRPTMEAMPTTAITVPQDLDLSLLSTVRSNFPSQHRLLIVSPYPASQNLKSLVHSWRRDVERNNVFLLTVNKEEGNNFFIDDLPDIDLAYTVFDHVSVCFWLVRLSTYIYLYHRSGVLFSVLKLTMFDFRVTGVANIMYQCRMTRECSVMWRYKAHKWEMSVPWSGSVIPSRVELEYLWLYVRYGILYFW